MTDVRRRNGKLECSEKYMKYSIVKMHGIQITICRTEIKVTKRQIVKIQLTTDNWK
jgi:hypothetical protein